MTHVLTVEQVDLPELAEMGTLFFAEAKFAHRFVPEVFRASWKKLIELGAGKILARFQDGKLVAVLGFIFTPDINDGKMVASEAFWFSHPDHRGAGVHLLRAYEQEARAMGAERINIVHVNILNAERLEHLYLHMGFTPVETHYTKELH